MRTDARVGLAVLSTALSWLVMTPARLAAG
jgi:hypothetical protein